jgi:ribosomal subunit interface protein
MKIAIHAVRFSLATQVRAYVEYRMFSATSRFGRVCERLRIRLVECEATRTGSRYRCSAVLDLAPAGRIRVRAAGERLYEAIDEAAERLARGVKRRLETKSQSRDRDAAAAPAQAQAAGRES